MGKYPSTLGEYDALLARRRTRPRFRGRMERKIFTIPVPLCEVIVRACDRYDVSESELLRWILVTYAGEMSAGGSFEQAMNALAATGVGLNEDSLRRLLSPEQPF